MTKEESLLVASQAQQVQFADEACALLFCKGIAVVTDTQALLWTDGQYHLQASHELNHDVDFNEECSNHH